MATPLHKNPAPGVMKFTLLDDGRQHIPIGHLSGPGDLKRDHYCVELSLSKNKAASLNKKLISIQEY